MRYYDKILKKSGVITFSDNEGREREREKEREREREQKLPKKLATTKMRKYFGRWHSFTKSCPQSLLGMQNYAKTLQKNIWLITALTHHSQVKLPEPIPDSVKYVPMQNKPCTKVGYGTVMLFHSHKYCKHSKSVEKIRIFLKLNKKYVNIAICPKLKMNRSWLHALHASN